MFEMIFKVKLTWAQVNLMDFTMGAGESPPELFICLKSLLRCLDELPLFCAICGGILCYRTFLGTSKCPRVSWKSLAIPFNFLKNDRPHVIKSDQL